MQSAEAASGPVQDDGAPQCSSVAAEPATDTAAGSTEGELDRQTGGRRKVTTTMTTVTTETTTETVDADAAEAGATGETPEVLLLTSRRHASVQLLVG